MSNKRDWMSFKKARAYVHTLNIKTLSDWRSYCQSGRKPKYIPTCAHTIYKNDGWQGYGDWLGNDYILNQKRKYRSFEDARAFVRTLTLKNYSEWHKYCQSGKKPADIPYSAYNIYKHSGWLGISDWLGNGHLTSNRKNFLSFEEARAFVRSLNIKDSKAWNAYCKSGEKPKNIPNVPGKIYCDKGWLGIGDWLGTGTIATNVREYLPFEKAKEYVRKLNIKDFCGWQKYCKSGLKPDSIPSTPSIIYKDKGWYSLGDWLGTGRISTQKREMLPYEKAKEYVLTLKIKNYEGWKKYCKSGLKPNNIPANPNSVYKDKGWSGIKDWLGTKN
jgi:hypothetical protein